MAQTPTSETVYKTRTLSKWFAIASIVLLVAVVWAVLEDYDRPWKNYTRQAQKIAAAQAEFKMKIAEAGIDPKKLDALEDDLNKLRKEQSRMESEVNAMVKTREDAYYALNNIYQGAKSNLDALQYKMEHAIGGLHEHEALKLREEYNEQKGAVADLSAQASAAERARDEALNRRRDFLSDQKKVEDQIAGIQKERGRLDKIIFSNDSNLFNLVRNAPLIDFMAPTVKIQQVVLPHLKDDYFFNKVPRVDRCMTCHATADKKGFEDFPQPFKTHPKVDLMVGTNSKHPIEKVGCTTCHAGVPQSVDFALAGHVPQNAEQEGVWEKKYGYYRSHNIGTPMLPLQMTEGKCIQCHANQIQLAGAPTFNTGNRLIERYGCYTCHKFTGYFEQLAARRKPAPSLAHVGSKLSGEWIQKWLWDPKAFRPTTLMPSFWKTHNNSDPESLARSSVEIDAITHFVLSKSTPVEPLKLASTAQGDIERGKKLLGEVGCLGCHASKDFPRVNAKDENTLGWRDPRLPSFAPELNQVGSKVTREWLVSWLAQPKHYDPGTMMPSMKLTNGEISDLAEYILSLRNPGFDAVKAPEADALLRDRMVIDLMEKTLSPDDAKIKFASMSLTDKQSFLGERLVNHYGCYTCHAIPGFEKAPYVGPELSVEGSKDVSKFAFENVKIFEKSRADWIFTKIRTPRIWDLGKKRAWDAKQKMPHFGFTKDQATALTAIILGHENPNVDKEATFPVTGQYEQITEGENLTRMYNCVGCHAIEKRYGEVLAHYPEDATMGPPNLNTEGRKAQVNWLTDYLLNPDVMIRPWVHIRMPQFWMPKQDAITIGKYFAALENNRSYPYDSVTPTRLSGADQSSAEKLIAQLGCYTCHALSKPGEDVSAKAPHFENIAKRLNPSWVAEWLHDPSAIMPGTRMPTLWPSSNEDDPKAPRQGIPGFFGDNADRQIDAIRDYLFFYPAKGPAVYPSTRVEPTAATPAATPVSAR